jgi:hypothetical protein
MNEADARKVVLLRAFETSTPRSEAWTDDDRLWASRAAAEVVGAGAMPGNSLRGARRWPSNVSLVAIVTSIAYCMP